MNNQKKPYFYTRRTLQIILGISLVIPLGFGAIGVLFGLKGFNWIFHITQITPIGPDLDSDFRFLAAMFFGWGLILVWMMPKIEKYTTLFRILALSVFLGGFGRLISVITVGNPNILTLFLLIVEISFPLLLFLQSRLTRHKTTHRKS